MVLEDEDREDQTEFEAAFEELANRIKLWSTFKRADRLAQIGRYAVILIGFDDWQALDKPVEPFTSEEPVLFLSVFGEGAAKVKALDTDTKSARFNLPELYEIDLSRSGETSRRRADGGIGKERVHWSRVMHVSESTLENNIYGEPRLERLWNRLMDMDKVLGGSAEMFWRAGYTGGVLNTQEGFDPPKGTAKDELEEQLELFDHGMQRWLQLGGMTTTFPSRMVPNPKPNTDAIKELLSSASGVPQRILFGSERGELASNQDEKNWNGRNVSRQLEFATPVMVREFVDRLILLGVFSVKTYFVEWPNLGEENEAEEAKTAKDWAEAAQIAGGGDARVIVSPDDFRDHFLPWAQKPTKVDEPPKTPEGSE